MDQPNPDAEYVSGEFDVGRTFSRIDTVTLEIVMPDGYEGASLVVGSNVVDWSLHIVVHDADVPLDVNTGFYFSPTTLSATTYRVNQELPYDTRFLPLNAFCGEMDPCPEPLWPEFLYFGRGRIAFAEVSSSYNTLTPHGDTTSSTTYGSPGEVSIANLIIVGTLVPEPHSLGMLIVLGLCSLGVSRRPR